MELFELARMVMAALFSSADTEMHTVAYLIGHVNGNFAEALDHTTNFDLYGQARQRNASHSQSEKRLA